MIDQYERCMRNKGYELKDKTDSSSGEPTIRPEKKEDPPMAIDKNAQVYVVGRTSRDPPVSLIVDIFIEKIVNTFGMNLQER